jgi:hypothetical protein
VNSQKRVRTREEKNDVIVSQQFHRARAAGSRSVGVGPGNKVISKKHRLSDQATSI